jgi:hypothetical protein
MNRVLLLTAVVLTTVAACRKTPNLTSLQNQQVVVTDRELDANFSSFNTYHISDTVRILASDPRDTILTGSIAQQLVQTVRTNMNNRGYTFVGKGGNPDLGMVLVVLKDVSSSTVCGGWWGGWWGGPWGWGWGYPWCGTYTYTVGTTLLSIYDFKNPETNGNPGAIWGMTAFGVFSNSNQTTNLNLTVNAINQAFNQSPYIKR